MKRDLVASLILRVYAFLFLVGFGVIVVKATMGQLLTTGSGEESLLLTILVACGVLLTVIVMWVAGRNLRKQYDMSFNNAEHKVD